MTIGRICKREVDLADANETVQEAGQRMGNRSVGTLVVVDDRKIPVGIITDRDLAVRVVGKGLDPNAVRVIDVMTEHPKTVHEETAIEDSLRIMRAKGVRRLPVVDGGGALVGLLAMDDILALLAEEFGILGRVIERSSPHILVES